MKHCIVNFSDSSYKLGQDRLVSKLKEVNYTGDVISFCEYNQVGSKTHKEVPYQFKVFAIEKARQMGYDVVLYCDASIYPIKDVMPCINYIKEKGYILEKNSFNVGQYSTDLCLNEFNLSRDDAKKIRLHSAGFTGINFNNVISHNFFNLWLKKAKEEKTFIGDWNNNNNQCSVDSYCKGHRHDQTVASIIANYLNMERLNPYFMQYKFDANNDTKYASIDENGRVIMGNINKTTIFICQGI